VTDAAMHVSGNTAMMNSNPPIRVCFVIDRLARGGTEMQLLQLIQGLDAARVKPSLCLLDGLDEVSRSLEPKCCPVLRLGVRSLHHPSTVLRAWEFGRFLRREQIDIVQTYFQDSTYFAVPVAKLAGVKHVIRTRRDLGYWVRPVNRRLGRLYNHLTTATVVNCEACRQAVIEQEGADPDRVVVIPNGIDLDRFAQIPAYTPSGNGQPRRVGMVANLRPVKGPDVFVRAAAIVVQSHPNVIFQIAGAGDIESVRRLARECGVEDRLELLGQVQDVPSFLAGLDVAVLASHSEGLSNSLLEYMAAGRPIVVTAVGGNTELIDDHVHGLLVPPNRPESLAESIVSLLVDTGLAAGLGTAARLATREQWSHQVAVQRYEEFYQRVAQ
jgi:glycosyltransferase involved in cell wall biosynthesis